MVRSAFALAAVALATLTAGCRMCAHPYDYCGPVLSQGDCQVCMPGVRACSILMPGGSVCCDSSLAPEMMLPMPDDQMVGPVPAVQQRGELVATRPQRQAASQPAR
jgi:hypothetical protein